MHAAHVDRHQPVILSRPPVFRKAGARVRTLLCEVVRQGSTRIRLHYASTKRREMEKVGLIAWTMCVPECLVQEVVLSWRKLPYQWRRLHYGAPFGAYTTERKTLSGDYVQIDLSVSSVIENLWYSRSGILARNGL